MKRIRLLLAVLFVIAFSLLFSTAKASTVRTYFVNQDFTGVAAHPTGWSTATDANYSLFGSGGYNYTTPAGQLNLTGSGTGNRGIKTTFPSSGSESLVYLDFDWVITGATVARYNALGMYLQDNAAAAFTTSGDIMILYCSGTDGKIHCQNIDNSTATFQNLSANGSFLKAGTTNALCDAANASTITTCPWAAGNTIHITATLNFSTHMITYLKISNTTTGLTPYENTSELSFISNTASNISKVCLTNTRVSNVGNGGSAALNVGLDNFKTYKTSDIGTLSSNSPQCISNGVTLTCSGTAPSGQTYYWQTSPTGTSTSYPTTSTYTVTASGNYYVRSLTTTGSVWSETSEALPIVVNPIAVGGTATPVDAVVPDGSHTTINLTGSTGTIKWYVSVNGSAYSEIVGATSTSLTTDNLSGGNTYDYKALLSSGECTTAYSTVASISSVHSSSVVDVTPTTLTSFNKIVAGTNSGSQSFVISGSDLTSDITITVPAGFELSTDNSTFSADPLIIPNDGGSVTTTSIYVRFSPSLLQTYSYTGITGMSVASTNVTTKYFDLSGIGIAAEPTTPASLANASSIMSKSANISWTAGDGAKYLVLYSTNSNVESANLPVDAVTYTVGSTTASGYIVGYVGSLTSATISSLLPNTQYYFAVFSYNDGNTSGAENYLTSSPATTSVLTEKTSETDVYFRSKATGIWSSLSTWESSSDNTSWHVVDMEPQAVATSSLITAANPVTITSTILPTGFKMENDATVNLQPGGGSTSTGQTFAKNIVGSGGAITIGTYTEGAPKNNTIYYQPTISNVSSINYILGISGGTLISQSTSWGTSFSGTVPSGTPMYVTSTVGSAGFTVGDGILSNVKVNLGADVRLMKSYNANSSSPYSNVSMGELSGNASSTVEGTWVSGRTLYYTIGGLGTSSIFEGSFKNYAQTADVLGIYKVGIGTLTLTNSNPLFTNGFFTINAGKVIMNGSIASTAVPVTVASGATLAGTGTIGGATTINGTLEGKMNFGSSLTLAGTTKINIPSFTAGEYDKVTAVGTLTQGGALVITVPATTPALNESIQILAAGTLTGLFTSVTYPSGYSYNQTTGYLTYIGKSIYKTTGWDGGTAPSTGMDADLESGTLSVVDNTPMGNVKVLPGAKLTVSADMTLAATSIVLESDATGTATLIDNGTITGNITVKQYMTGSTNVETGNPNGRFWYVSSPISNGTSGTFAPTTGNKLWAWNEGTTTYASISADDATLTAGKGYVVRLKDNTTVSYTGTPNKGDVNIEITRTGTTNSYRGFNLIGNPYPSFAELKSADNVDIEQSIWYRSLVSGGSTMVFDTYNFLSGEQVVNSASGVLSAHIPPMQAFWVKTHNVGTSNVAFKQANRTHQTSVKLRSVETDTMPLIRLQITNGKCKDQTLISLHNKALDGIDAYDSHKMTNAIDSFPEIFTVNGNEELAINGIKHDGRTKTLPLGFRTGKKGDFKLKVIELKNLGDSVKVILKDRIKNCEKELKDSSEYDFTSEVATTTDRFTIVITANAPTALSRVNAGSADAFSTGDHHIQVRLIGTADQMANVTVYNTVGQKIGTFAINAANTVLNKRFAPGIYMVNVAANGLQITKKVVINQ